MTHTAEETKAARAKGGLPRHHTGTLASARLHVAHNSARYSWLLKKCGHTYEHAVDYELGRGRDALDFSIMALTEAYPNHSPKKITLLGCDTVAEAQAILAKFSHVLPELCALHVRQYRKVGEHIGAANTVAWDTSLRKAYPRSLIALRAKDPVKWQDADSAHQYVHDPKRSKHIAQALADGHTPDRIARLLNVQPGPLWEAALATLPSRPPSWPKQLTNVAQAKAAAAKAASCPATSQQDPYTAAATLGIQFSHTFAALFERHKTTTR